MQEETGITPEALSTKVELSEFWKLPHKIWLQVKDSRRPGFGALTHLPYSEYRSYCSDIGMFPRDIADMWEYVNKLDSVWIEKMTEKHKDDKSDSASPKSPISKSPIVRP